MEEENGEDSEMLDAMEGWDSDQDDPNREVNNGLDNKQGVSQQDKINAL